MLLFESQIRILFYEVLKNDLKIPPYIVEKTFGSGLTGPRPKIHGKMDTITNSW